MNNTQIQTTTSQITFANRWEHLLTRLAVNRMGHRVAPGLYKLGQPTSDSPVFVSANYTLSFDALRSALVGKDAYLLVLDTKGINVWCAAGKGTFGTAELINRIRLTELDQVVNHHTLILPQLGAPGVCSYEVKRETGFEVEFGPIRATDLPQYMKTHKATAEMRQVKFNLLDRLILVPVEFVGILLPLLAASIVIYFLGGWLNVFWLIAACLAGTVLLPILLPWLPTRDFSSKGLILGFLISTPFVAAQLARIDQSWFSNLLRALPKILIFPAVTAFITLNFTGSTTFTSRTGVRREIYKYIPVMAWMAGIGLLITIIQLFGFLS